MSVCAGQRGVVSHFYDIGIEHELVDLAKGLGLCGGWFSYDHR